jgi:hypothetical protein
MFARTSTRQSNHGLLKTTEPQILVLEFCMKIGKAVGLLLPNEFITTHPFTFMYLFRSFLRLNVILGCLLRLDSLEALLMSLT